ncbi:F-box/WD repeat-containing protein 7 isoform X1 [Gouania willdenowi]|uniref:F-box/WD repeat-containing protein 7 n=1 Tax=Gouania willdenowi TaxID=441366 RepID=A0A8C5HD72_GOUWI|nr:F-box/WD repeat-containing protein 7 isoform X1 [Gouania willdenowi]XP_028298776.1 F-box/WD repeat-containing protein 7 isoform X1 [Gouania willdenowi]XP_028298791.1 F-box/WD repeat-containing protein 7 isoform X1 [Gouania willdenowi]
MNQDLLSGGSSSRRTRGPGGPTVRGNASSTARAPQQAAEEGDEDEHMNRVVEEEEQQHEASQVVGNGNQQWASRDSGASNGPQRGEEGEEDEEGLSSEVNGRGKGARWLWAPEHRRLRGQPLGEDQEEEEEENNNSSSQQEEEDTEERTEGGEDQGTEEEEREEGEEDEDEGEEEMDQESDEFEHSVESGRDEEEEEDGEGDQQIRSPSLRNSASTPNNNVELGCTRQSSSNKKMKRKLDHGPEVRPFPSGKKPCKGPEYSSPTGIVPCPSTPTTFGHIRTANSQGQQRRRITSIQPPTGLQEWLRTFQSWTGPEKLLALDELIDSCEPTQVKHMMQVIEPQFQRDFISLLPKELALYVLSFLEPKDLLQAAQTCRYWRILAEDNLLWREKCREEGIDEPLLLKKRKIVKPGFTHSPWKSAYIRQHRIDTNWRRGDLKSPKVLKGHDDHVITCLQFCGNRIVSGSDDNTLKVWSAITGKCLRTLVGHTGGVWSSQMRDNIIISGSTDRTLKVWNAETGECIHTLYGHTSTVRCMHLHEKRVVSGSRDATLRVWDIETGQCLHVLMGHVAAVRCVQYDGRRVVSGAYDFMVKVWDPETETCLHTLQGHTNRVYSLQFDGIHVVSGSLDTSIRVWDVETGNCIHTLTGHQSLTSGMELKDNILVSGNADSTVKIWDIKTGQCLQTLQGPHKHQSAVTCLQFNKNFVITSSDDGTVKLWDLKTGEFIRNLVTLESGGSGGVVWRIRASNTKLVCAVGSRNGTEETKLLVLDFDVDMK